MNEIKLLFATEMNPKTYLFKEQAPTEQMPEELKQQLLFMVINFYSNKHSQNAVRVQSGLRPGRIKSFGTKPDFLLKAAIVAGYLLWVLLSWYMFCSAEHYA